MRIAIIGKLFASIQITSAMGQERFIYYLSYLLAKKGHEVTLFASSDSRIEGVKIIPVIKKNFWKASRNPKKVLNCEAGRAYGEREALGYLKTLYYLRNHTKDFDIVHDNSDNFEILGLHKFLVDLPLMSTLHLPPYYLATLNKMTVEELGNYYIAISKKQKKIAKKIKVFDVVYNGVDLKKFSFSEDSKERLSWIGRIDPYKGLGAAIEVAEKAKVPLKIAGPIYNEKYFREEIQPRLNKRIRYVGELSGLKLKRFYKRSKAILFPVRWEEPFGFVIVEAMACGTPVIAFRRGAIPELIVQGKTGYICPKDKVPSMVKAVKKLYSMSDRNYKKMRVNCRKHVEENFSVNKMVENYENVYQKVINDWKVKNK
ncbi:MAG: glycosyltransferase family 4 protein [Patescibacteria group bacterium]|nr:glycosyltransferase family 4 protein [Patescibacteria group bacterium]